MTKKDLAKLLFEKGVFSTKVEAEKKVDIIFDTMEKVLLNGESISIINWGKLEVVERAPRLGRNPKTGEEVKIGTRKSIKFRPGKALLEKLN
ncbi:HU family DNA-binding protein [Fusobacterium gastrosuis]|uniref:HU family DNA-binding protein n=2 Tax=Fusobacterium TaxID=848 RepID=UPI001F4F6156|nr:HU family DNA-binding protein [Fusobacterium gastrosuis]MDD7391814.1 HU family DNA-binding protein [Fusobacteriaceae bacterium]MDD7410780.1 HU family DNA-binding protein [Fusobacteriaceae bacterium]MDY5305270.1 HU family DNA-binding protein [Fusobacterium gastrosuis]MDY5713133.1 HU family DNA-binding protein [Fusobacterium gastrosuis]MDY5795095.1 HU family DNA-binding protein [Fusobacterium gastrosuis]